MGEGSALFTKRIKSMGQAVSTRYSETVTLSRQSVFDRLGLSRTAIAASTGGGSMPEIRILSKTEGHRIKKIEVGGSIFTGPEIRNKLGLRSAEFTWKAEGDRIAITTYGYGHGVGMSQWGANGMVKKVILPLKYSFTIILAFLLRKPLVF